ncbi:MAG: hypothetical protein KAT68_12620 [Bacteroidales bacterium]|nr:hypothetical protein [Bacteroidales bacterium]
MMKKISYLVMFLFVISASINAQVIKYNPLLTQGYLVFYEDENVSSWEIEISQKIFNDGKFEDNGVVDKIKLLGSNYIKLPREYYAPDEDFYSVTVKGIGNDGKAIVSVGSVLMPPICEDCGSSGGNSLDCSWKCNGETYAWSINKYSLSDGGNAYLSLGSNVASVDPGGYLVTPYFQYMDQTEYDYLKADHSFLLEHYLISSTDIDHFDNLHFTRMTGVLASDEIKNKDGYILTGIVYGVAKEKGHWNGNLIKTGYLAITDGICINSKLWAINTMNNYSDDFDQYGLPPLVCNIAGDGGGPSPIIPDVIAAELRWTQGEDGQDDVYDFIDYVNTVLYGDDENSDSFWPDDVRDISICQINTVGESYKFTESDLFSAEGEFIGPSFQLDAGLYNITFRFNNNSFFNIIADIKEPIINNCELSNFLEPTIFPVPIDGDNFSIKLKATASLIFTYELFDSNGNRIFDEKLSIKKDYDEIFQIQPAGGIPSGILINRFEFKDGSYISITTQKL